MLKANLTAGTYAANATIPLTVVFNTNNGLNLTNNQIVIRKPGFVEIEGTITLIGTVVGDINVSLVDENGNTLTSVTGTFTAIGDYVTLPLYDALRILADNTTTNTKVYLVLGSAVTVNSGVVTTKFIK